jgi:hypothetical protein
MEWNGMEEAGAHQGDKEGGEGGRAAKPNTKGQQQQQHTAQPRPPPTAISPHLLSVPVTIFIIMSSRLPPSICLL